MENVIDIERLIKFEKIDFVHVLVLPDSINWNAASPSVATLV